MSDGCLLEMLSDGLLLEMMAEKLSDLVLRNLDFVGMWIRWCDLC